MSYEPLVYKTNGGDKLIVASGGEIEIQSGATLDVQDGANMNIDVLTLTDVMTIGTFASLVQGSGIPISSSQTGAVKVYSDDVGASIASSVRGILSRFLLTVDQAGGSIRAAMGQLKLATGVDVTTGIYTAVQGYVEMAGTHVAQTGATFSAIDASVEITTSLTVDSGGEFFGVHVETTGAGTITNNGTCAAIGITTASGAANWPVGIQMVGGFERGIDFGGATVGTTTDGVLMRAGTGIGTSGLAFATAGQRAFAFYLRPPATSGTFIGVRPRSIADPASGAVSIDNLLCQTSVVASKNATTLNSGFFEIITKGTNTVGYARCILTNVDSAAAVTYTTGLTNVHIRTHTRGDETMSGVDEMLRIENEAVGGNGRQMDSFIRCMATSMSGGIKSAGYLIDAGTDTSLLATAVLRLPDDEVTAWDAATDSGDTEAGAIKVVIGTSTRYILLYSDAPA